MGDPHHNTWGGKNNSWGNRNRKPRQSNQRQNRQNNQHYEPNKLFNTIAGGVMIFLAGAFGFSLVTGAISNIKGAKDTVDKAKNVADKISNTQINNSPSNQNGQSLLDKIISDIVEEADIDLDAEDVADLLENVSNSISENNLKQQTETLIELNYNDANTLDKYKKNVIGRLKKYNKPVTFALINNEIVDNDTMISEVEKMQALALDNIDLISDLPFRRIITGGKSNVPGPGKFTFLITFTTE